MKKKSNRKEFDCHGLSYGQVEDLLPNWLLSNQDRMPMYIITGRSESMRVIVGTILSELGMHWAIKDINPGEIIVL